MLTGITPTDTHTYVVPVTRVIYRSLFKLVVRSEVDRLFVDIVDHH